MQHFLFLALTLGYASFTSAQRTFPVHQLSVNGFRNPSIGLEYQHRNLSVHSGYYLTNFESGVTTTFLKTGLTWWFFPVSHKKNPSSFYLGANYLRGLTRDYRTENALGLEAGFRWYFWKGLNLRIGMIALAADGHDLKLNPTPGISYAFTFKHPRHEH